MNSQTLLRTCFFINIKQVNKSFKKEIVVRPLIKRNVGSLSSPTKHSKQFTSKKLLVGLQNINLINNLHQPQTISSPTRCTSNFTATKTMTDEQEKASKEIFHNVNESEGWLTIGQYSIFGWSVSGMESCIVIKSDDVQLAFDMGIAVPESIKSANVFITHGHVDHIGAVIGHLSKRSLLGMKPAKYYVPPILVESLTTVVKSHFEMAQAMETFEHVNILPIIQEDVVRLNSRYFVKAFPTIHRIPSQGYILYREEKKLKQEYKGMQGFEVAALHREGKVIHDIVITPEIAYCGDTTFDIFTNPPTPDLLNVKILITETTFLDEERGKNMVQKARDRGHTHLSELCQHADLFKDVGHIVLVHFSNKYPAKYIRDCIYHKLPPELRMKVTPATVAKTTVASSLY